METKNRFSKRLLSLIMVLAMVFTLVPANIAMADADASYYYVVSADKASASEGDVVTVTVTLFSNGGTMAYLRALQYYLTVDTTKFSYEVDRRGNLVLEEVWDEDMNDGYGIGYIDYPGFSVNDTLIKMVTTSLRGYYIDEESEIFNATNTVVGKIQFTALTAVPDVSACFTLSNPVVGTDNNGATVAQTSALVQMADLAAADTAEQAIASLPAPITYSDKAAVANARKAYDDLSPTFLRSYVENLSVLTAAEAAIATMETAIANVEALIDEIGEVIYPDSKTKIDAARNAYNALADDAQKAAVENYSTLTAAEDAYDKLEAEAEQSAADKAAAEAVDVKINAIGTVQYTAASKNLIDEASAAYEGLTPAQQALVTGKTVLDDAVAAYNKLDKEVKDYIASVNAFDGDNITIDSANELQDLLDVYDVLDTHQKEALDVSFGYSVKDKLDEYTEIYFQQLDEVLEVIALIQIIGDVTLDSEDAIIEAEEAYKAIPDVNKKHVLNLDTLVKARETYNTLVAYKAAADEVVADITALTPPTAITKDNVGTVAAKASSIRASYDNLPDKTMVEDRYLEMLAEVEKACNTVWDDLAAAEDVDDLIAAIGAVSLGSLEKIEAAEDAYAELSDMAKTYVTKKDVLDSARETYEILKAEQDAVDAVEELIVAIGGVDNVTLGSLADIEVAEKAYEDLDDTLKTRVENYKELTDARAKYEELLASKGKIDAVIEQINAIGEVTLGSLAKIQAAEAAYSELTDEEKASVENYQTLLDARDAYNALKDAADKEEADREAAAGVDELIIKIGEVTLDSERAINDARNAYEGLTDDQQAYIVNLDILEEAEARLEELKADKAEVDAVIELINEIGTVTYPDSKDAIDDAYAAYEALRDDLKDAVANYGLLVAAQQTYASLEADYNAVQDVIALIDAIGDVEYTVEVKERINAAEEAYRALREELRADVTNVDVLEAAKTDYEALKPTYSITEEPVAEYGNVYVVVFNNIPEGKKVTLDGIEAQMVTAGEDVYYVVLSSAVLNPEDVVVEEGTCVSFLIGDTDGNGTVTATDALAANQKSGNEEVDCYTADAMAYVRSDINGSASITAYDALMIARIAADIEVVHSFVTGK